MIGEKPHIMIGICTRQRNTLLRRLIDGIQDQPMPAGYSVEIVVIDNNDVPTAEPALDGTATRFPISVEHEPQAGLVFARNHALDAATARGATWFIGVDDDEWVDENWLAEMVDGFETHSSPVLIAQCIYEYDGALSPYRQARQLQSLTKGKRPSILSSGNYAIHRRIFADDDGLSMRFDPFFNESGGEDVDFFLRIQHIHGYVAASVPGSIVYEAWDGERATLSYHLKRCLRNQVAGYHILRRHRRLGLYGNVIQNAFRVMVKTNRHLVYGIGKLLLGALTVPFKRNEGQKLIGLGMERCVLAAALGAFLFGMLPVGYGASVQGSPDGVRPNS
ncbi:glycosyltransferase family 2 protein [Yoonia sp. I 8.24]|uniref:glycosyltransferase family 2 protein n=1 Tax=Yoonia sp. I 8.24 TaxID=1537229 RepID=UPI001EDE7A66|nr:glycosyltransferase [Yoonia sp. I 8.24]MCG3268397.1 glycosyltransferase family 2 protein [Yoonia sp. I 8.24]